MTAETLSDLLLAGFICAGLAGVSRHGYVSTGSLLCDAMSVTFGAVALVCVGLAGVLYGLSP